MQSNIYYTALKHFDAETQNELNWNNYIKWSKLTQLKELVSLDGILNELIFQPELSSKYDQKHMVIDGEMLMPFFNSSAYVIEKVKGLERFNFLAIVKEPNNEKASLATDFEFVGYELLDKEGSNSALTNCGGFDEIFSPTDLNEYGLITDYYKTKKIQQELLINNPNQQHSNCFLYEVWRHKKIGRKDYENI
jgi:hypothetical protein